MRHRVVGGLVRGKDRGKNFHPSEKVQLGEGWALSEKVEANRVGQQQEVWGAVPWEQELLGEWQ